MQEGQDLLELLLERFNFISVTRYYDYPDGEAEIPAADVSIWVTDDAGNRKQVTRVTAREAVMAALGKEERLSCSGPCGRRKMATEFSRDANRPTGRCQRCKVCERERVKRYSRAKRGQDPDLPPAPCPRPLKRHSRPVQDIIPFPAPPQEG